MKLLDIIFESYDPEVIKIQLALKKTGKYNLGKSGKNKDGVDGVYGPLTDYAYRTEYGKPSLKLIKNKIDKPSSSSFSSQSNNTYDSSGWNAVLVGGLYKPIDTQVSLFKQGFGNKNVKGFSYDTDSSVILDFLKSHPNLPVFLFSAGCAKAGVLSSSSNVDRNRFYVIEPYYSGGATTSSVQKAVDVNGVPASHIFVGGNSSRGLGIVKGASSSNASSHWDALPTVGSRFKN